MITNSSESETNNEVFNFVQVSINPINKKFYSDKQWASVLKDVAKQSKVTMAVLNGYDCFEGDWENAEHAHELLKLNIFSVITEDEKDLSPTEIKKDKVNLEIKKDTTEKSHIAALIDNSILHFSIEVFNMTIMLIKGDILKEQVKAIVCPIASNLSSNSLLSKICQETGYTNFKQNLKMPCDIDSFKSKKLGGQAFIITLIPPASSDPQMNMVYLCKVYENIFNHCQNSDIESVALSSISSEISEFTPDVCASAAWKSIQKYATTKFPKSQTLKVIRFVVDNNDHASYFKTIFNRLSQRHDNPPPIENKPKKQPNIISKSLPEKAPKADRKITPINKCPLCAFEISGKNVTLECSHRFCSKCITDHFHYSKTCPVCYRFYGIQSGNQPFGRMNHYIIDSSLSGYEEFGTIVIQYEFGNGIQNIGHPKPGLPYNGGCYSAYLPANSEGHKILELLRKAFNQKLIFTISKAIYSGDQEYVTWNGIDHKTSKSGGKLVNGYPDAEYLKRVRQQLAAKGIQ